MTEQTSQCTGGCETHGGHGIEENVLMIKVKLGQWRTGQNLRLREHLREKRREPGTAGDWERPWEQ